MLPDDLVGGVSLDPLGAAVPARDVPGGIQHEDGVVADALYHELVDASPVHNRIGKPGVADGDNGCLRFSTCLGGPGGERMLSGLIRHQSDGICKKLSLEGGGIVGLLRIEGAAILPSLFRPGTFG